MKSVVYCSYHSCFISKKMAEKHGCFEKNKDGKKLCRYAVIMQQEKGDKTLAKVRG